jgi:hypothetical protein
MNLEAVAVLEVLAVMLPVEATAAMVVEAQHLHILVPL